MRFHADTLRALMPLCVDRPPFGVGGSLWLQTRNEETYPARQPTDDLTPGAPSISRF